MSFGNNLSEIKELGAAPRFADRIARIRRGRKLLLDFQDFFFLQRAEIFDLFGL
jgi:hypothetical protein